MCQLSYIDKGELLSREESSKAPRYENAKEPTEKGYNLHTRTRKRAHACN